MKQIFFYIIAIIGAFALYFWKENEILAAGFVALVLYIGAKYKENKLRKENAILKTMHKAELRRNNLNSNTMTDTEAEVISAQLNYVNNLLGATHPAKQVHEETIENFESVIGGGGILNQPPT